MARATVTLERVDSRELVSRLDAALGSGAVAIAFDADGTLWSGDVAEDVFSHAVENELLRAEPAEALARAARAGGVDANGTPSQIAKRLFDAYLAGRYPEREVCEVMAWCFAGFRPDEVAQLSREVLEQKRLRQRLQRELEPVLDWARRRGVRPVVISASPRPIVETAAEAWAIPSSDIAASTPVVESGKYAPRLVEAIPYAEKKVWHGRRLIGSARWLASFGDNGFDGEMIAAAEIRVAVRPKPSLCARAGDVAGLVELSG